MSDPFEVLDGEHRAIEKVLTALEATARVEPPLAFFQRAVDFITRYADGSHHAKEEEHLFPLLATRGMPLEMGPIGVMLAEHRQGRAHVAAMQQQIADSDLAALRREVQGYAALMRDHIAKEDQVLFPMGRGMLTPEDVDALASAFAAVTEPDGGYAAYEALADDLLREVRAPA